MLSVPGELGGPHVFHSLQMGTWEVIVMVEFGAVRGSRCLMMTDVRGKKTEVRLVVIGGQETKASRGSSSTTLEYITASEK